MNLAAFLAPWVIGREPGDALELAFVLSFIVGGILILYAFDRFWRE